MNVSTFASKLILSATYLNDHADFLERHTFPMNDARPYDEITYLDVSVDGYYKADILITVHGPDARLLLRKVCKEFGGKWDKSAVSTTFKMTQTLEGDCDIAVSAPRKLVCTPRVVGSKEVEQVDFKNAPRIKVQEDVVEWDCPPSLLSLTND